MAITITDLTHNNTTTDATSFDTASVAPTSGNVVLAWTLGVAADNDVAPTISGMSMTWTAVANVGGAGDETENRTMKMWRGVSNGNSGAITFDWSKTQVRCFWGVVELRGVDTSGVNGANAIVQAVTDARDNGGGNISSWSTTLASFAHSTNATFGTIHNSGSSTVTPGSGFVEVGTSTVESQVVQSQRKYSADTTIDWTFTNQDDEIVVIALELSEPRLNSDDWTSAEIQSDNTKVSGSSDHTDFPALIADGNLSSAVYAGLVPSAVTATHLETAGEGTDADSFTTGSVAMSANKLILATVVNLQTSANTPTCTSDNRTWTQVDTQVHPTNSFTRITTFRSLSSNADTEALTFDMDSQSQLRCAWTISEFDNVDIGGTNGADAIVQSATTQASTVTSLSVTLGAFGDSRNATYGAFGLNDDLAITEGSGFTELGDVGVEFCRIQSEWKNTNDTSVDASFSSVPQAVGLAIEIKNGAGRDLRISTDSAGTTEVPFEIVSLDTAGETSQIWAKVPTLEYDANTSLFIWYGNASAIAYAVDDSFGSQNVWTASDGQWNLEEASGTRAGSSANSHTLTDNNTVTSGTGQMGEAADFEADNSESLSVADHASLDQSGSFTIKGWIKLEGTGRMSFLGKGQPTDGGTNDGYIFAYRGDQANNPLTFYINGNSSDLLIVSGPTSTDMEDAAWHHVAAVITATTGAVYLDGSDITDTGATFSDPGDLGNANAFYLGRDNTGNYFDGLLDEMAVVSTNLSADWIATEYNNQNAPSTFWSEASTGITILIGGGIIG